MSCFSVGHLSAVNQREWQAHMSPVERAMEGKNRLMYRGSSRGRVMEGGERASIKPGWKKMNKYDKYDNWNDEILVLGIGFRCAPKGISPSFTVIFSLSVPNTHTYKPWAPTHACMQHKTQTFNVNIFFYQLGFCVCKTRRQQEVTDLRSKPCYKVGEKIRKNCVGSSGRTLSCEDRRCMAQGR